MIKSELKTGCAKSGVVNMSTPLKRITYQVLTKTHCSFVFGQVQSQ